MAVNLINSDQIEVNQSGNNINLSIVDNANIGNIIVDSIRTKNIFDGIMEQGSFLPDTGVPVSSTTRIRSASFTNVKAGNNTISLYNNNNFDVAVYVYDIDGTWKSSESIIGWQSLPYTINILGERKIKIAIRNKNNSTIVPSDVQNVQIEEGGEATTYSPYQNLTGEENYSTEEIRIGTWIDGKPLYRKVINAGTITASNTTIANIQNIDTLVSIKGSAYNSQFGQKYGIPNVHNDIASYYINLLVAGNGVVIRYGPGFSQFSNVMVILEYTKTTD